MTKKKRQFHTKEQLSEAVSEYRTDTFIPNRNKNADKTYDVDVESWFDIKSSNYIPSNSNSLKRQNTNKKIYYARKYYFVPTDDQKEIIRKWNHNLICIHNIILRKIKKTNNHSNLDWGFYRNQLKFDGVNSKTYDMPQHMIDYNVKKTVAMFKTLDKNRQFGYIKHYRVRYKRHENYCSKSIYIDNDNILKSGKISSLGELDLYEYEKLNRDQKSTSDIYGTVNNRQRKKIHLDKKISRSIEIRYVKPTNEYIVYVSYLDNPVSSNQSKEEFVSLDPGVRTFMTGVTPSNMIEIGTKCSKRIRTLLKDMDRTNRKKTLKKKLKEKHSNRIRNKIKNIVNDLHWKTISHLTNNYNKVFIGDLSPKSVISKENPKLTKMTKRVLTCLSIYKFRERLEWKCDWKNVEYEMINEFYSSKTCSLCGFYKKDLGGSDMYSCNYCNSLLNRDINGARNIYHIHMMNTLG
jgi:transposase